MCPAVQSSLATKTHPWLGFSSAGGSTGTGTVSATEPSQCWAGITPSHHVWDGVGGPRFHRGGAPSPPPHDSQARPGPTPAGCCGPGSTGAAAGTVCGESATLTSDGKRVVGGERCLLNHLMRLLLMAGAGWVPRAAPGKSQGLLQAQHWHGTLPPQAELSPTPHSDCPLSHTATLCCLDPPTQPHPRVPTPHL